jgi:uncharacterized protein YukE
MEDAVAQLGADVEQLDSLSAKFNNVAGELESLIGQLGGQIGSTWWQGSDAERFRGDWDGQYRGQLQAVVNRLRDTATQVTAQANQQRATSGQ